MRPAIPPARTGLRRWSALPRGRTLCGSVLLEMPSEKRTIEASGRSVEISSPDKIYFPEIGATKFDLASYYVEIGDVLCRIAAGRPALLERFPDGAGKNSFFQKRVPKNAPGWLETTEVTTPNGTRSNALVVADIAHVLWAVNLGCLGLHLWPYRADDPAHADELRIDLDPQPGVGFDEVREAAGHVRALLDELGIVGYPKTSGNRGVHVYVRLDATMGQLRGPRRRHRPGPGARTSPSCADHGAMVEGGTGRAGVRRLQPERSAQDGLRGLVRPAQGRRPGLDASQLGRGRIGPSRRAHAPYRALNSSGAEGTRGLPWSDEPQSLQPLLDMAARDRENGLHDAPWPPEYPKQPDEPPRVAPSRAKKG